MTFSGGLVGARIAAKGAPLPGFAPTRTGILGNINISGTMDSASAIVSLGEIGDSTLGTGLSVGTNSGIIAATGVVSLTGKTPSGYFFNDLSASTSSAAALDIAALDAIFTDANNNPLVFDLPGSLNLQGLTEILNNLAALQVGSDGILKDPKS
jgi:hypothetical protein